MKKRVLSLFLILIFIFIGCFSVNAENNITISDIDSTINYNTWANIVIDDLGIKDLNEFKQYLFEQLWDMPSLIDISKYNIDYSKKNMSHINDIIWYNMPECFHVDGIGYTYFTSGPRTGLLKEIKVDSYYYDNPDDYHRDYYAAMAVANDMVKGIKDNPYLNDVEKCLILHDRLCVHAEYDYYNFNMSCYDPDHYFVPQDDYNIYGTLVKKIGVCSGYASSYMMMLNMCGIENSYCNSDYNIHAWNIIYIDGEAYHIDTTWDDLLPDKSGQVGHLNFMISTQTLISQGHDINPKTNIPDFDTSPNSQKYENEFWVYLNSPVVLVNNKMYYYLANDNGTFDDDEDDTTEIYLYDGNNSTIIYQTPCDFWMVDEYLYYPGNYGILSATDNFLLFSDSKNVYCIDTCSYNANCVHTISDEIGYNIYGLNYIDGKIVLDVAQSPNYDIKSGTTYVEFDDGTSEYVNSRYYQIAFNEPAVTHTFGQTVYDAFAGCCQPGRTHKTCSKCGQTFYSFTERNNVHGYTLWKWLYKPTEFSDGIEQHTCIYCNHREYNHTDAISFNDMDDDGVLTLKDASVIMKVLVGAISYKDVDFNGDSKCNLKDLLMVKKELAKQ